ncbi:MAG: hypothetical protein ACSHWY_00130 [Octadecabacter sp.]
MTAKASDGADVFLFSGLCAQSDQDILAHFIAHYEALGVDKSRMFLDVFSTDDAAIDHVCETIEAMGLPTPEILRTAFKAGAASRQRRTRQRTLTQLGDWVVCPDIRDLAVYPRDIPTAIRALEESNSYYLEGPIFERATALGTAPKITPAPPIFEQFAYIVDASQTGSVIRPNQMFRVMLAQSCFVIGANGRGIRRDLTKENVAGLERPDLSAAHKKLVTRVSKGMFRSFHRCDLHHVLELSDMEERMRFPAQVARFALRSKHQPAVVVASAKPRPRGLRPHRDARVIKGRTMHAAAGWKIRQLTAGGEGDAWHSHSYYDARIFDPLEERAAAYRANTPNRPINASDTADVGHVDLESGAFVPVAKTSALSWQMGPLSQWTATGDLVWNDCEQGQFVARILRQDGSLTPQTYDRSLYSICPNAEVGLSLSFARLSRLRPAYGYVGGVDPFEADAAPKDDGIWAVDMKSGQSRLILSLARALECLRTSIASSRDRSYDFEGQTFWFNHPKINPSGTRFTVKFRWRKAAAGFDGVSLTCGLDGSDLRLLAWRTSHVMWLDDETLFWWSSEQREIVVARDVALGEQNAPTALAAGAFPPNVHGRPATGKPDLIAFDTPYGEVVSLHLFNRATQTIEDVASFRNHFPAKSKYRCDLHPVPSKNARRILVTTLAGGVRQLALVEKCQA